MVKPLVAVVGRPNVGKSTLFNKIAGQRISIVENIPGVTRDRIYADAEWCGYSFTMIDTGGLEIKSQDEMWMHIKTQAEIAIEIADVILFMVDGKQGIMPDDYDVAEYLRATKKPIVLCVNKVDNNDVSLTYDFYMLGLGEPIPASAEQSKNIGDLLDEIVKHFKIKIDIEEKDETIKIAVVGKPNAGKSSLVNKILGYERVIVSGIAGTTRDTIDTPFSYGGKDYTIIDTAGIRRKSKVSEDVEYYSVIRSINAIRKADVVAIIIDSEEGITEQDVKICGLCHEARKPSVLVMNKWDKIEKSTHTIDKFNNILDQELKFMPYYLSVYVSALTGQRVGKIIDTLNVGYDNAHQRITTGVLNDVMQDAISVNEPPSKNGRRLKIYYVTQVNVAPPTFIVFVNDNELMHFSYKRYLENNLRKAFDFRGTPISLIIRNKEDNI